MQLRTIIHWSCAILTTSACLTAQTTVLTYRNNRARTGLNLTETILTPTNVKSSTFGKLFVTTLDGVVDAQPLYVPRFTIPNHGTHNVLIVATENDSLYALDADNGATLWHTSLLKSGETPSDNRGCSQVTPIIGITSTPVIVIEGAGATIYAVAMSKDPSSKYHHRLHAISLTTGTEQFGGPVEIQAKYPGTGDNSSGGFVTFQASQYKERSGLLLLNGMIYLGWASHCDHRPYTGWIMAYDANTLAQTAVLNVVPNGSEGAIWGAGGGFAADSSGNIYFLDANGDFDTTLNDKGFPTNGNFGNSFIKLNTANNKLKVADYFAMYNTVAESDADEDLGSSSAIVLPDMTDSNGKKRHLTIGAGKDTNIYLADRDNMGKFNPQDNSGIYQELTGVLSGGMWSVPAYYNNSVYFGPVNNSLQQFKFSEAKLLTSPSSVTVHHFAYPGVTPSISANGTTNGIVWVVESSSPAVLRAFSADNLATTFYNSNQAANGRDQFGAGNKFMSPTIANGKVYVGTPTGIAVFGLLH